MILLKAKIFNNFNLVFFLLLLLLQVKRKSRLRKKWAWNLVQHLHNFVQHLTLLVTLTLYISFQTNLQSSSLSTKPASLFTYTSCITSQWTNAACNTWPRSALLNDWLLQSSVFLWWASLCWREITMAHVLAVVLKIRPAIMFYTAHDHTTNENVCHIKKV